MLSTKTYVEIDRVTADTLRMIAGQEVIERVSVIRGHEQLLSMHPERTDLEKASPRA